MAIFDWIFSLFRRRPSPPVDPGRPPDPVNTKAARVIELVNAERAKRGLTPLNTDGRLAGAAYEHAEWMASTGNLSHFGPGGGPGPRATSAGYHYSLVAENIAAGQKTPEQVVNAWMNSKYHRENILATLGDAGVGVAGAPGGSLYWCLMLGRQTTEREVQWPAAWYVPDGIDERPGSERPTPKP